MAVTQNPLPQKGGFPGTPAEASTLLVPLERDEGVRTDGGPEPPVFGPREHRPGEPQSWLRNKCAVL